MYSTFQPRSSPRISLSWSAHCGYSGSKTPTSRKPRVRIAHPEKCHQHPRSSVPRTEDSPPATVSFEREGSSSPGTVAPSGFSESQLEQIVSVEGGQIGRAHV